METQYPIFLIWNCKYLKPYLNLRWWINKHSQRRSLHSLKVNVWWIFTTKKIITPFFFENITPTGRVSSSVTVEKYRYILRNFFMPTFQKRYMENANFYATYIFSIHCSTSTGFSKLDFYNEKNQSVLSNSMATSIAYSYIMRLLILGNPRSM